MNADFTPAAAFASLCDFATQSGQWMRGGGGRADLTAASTLLQRLTGEALGLKWAAPAGGNAARTNEVLQILADLRNEARKQKNFALSDNIRDRLGAIGIELRDGPEGTSWAGV
jgi:cysteinyl-tRNA synthetase